MSDEPKKPKDESDKLRDGELSPDPFEGTKRFRAAMAQNRPAEVRSIQSQACNLPAERGLLAALLWAGANAPETLRVTAVLDILENGTAFFGHGHADVFDAIRACCDAKVEHDPIAVHAELVRQGHDRKAGGVDGLLAIKDSASTVSEVQARAYAVAIRDAAMKRVTMQEMRELLADADDPKKTIDEVIDRAMTVMHGIEMRLAGAKQSVALHESTVEVFKELASTEDHSMATGLSGLDARLNGGFRPSEVTIIAARTSVGKSTLCAQIVEHIVTKDDSRVAFYVTLEMSHAAFASRLLAARAGVPLSNLRRKVINPSQWSKLSEAASELSKKNIEFADAPTQTLASIYRAALYVKRQAERKGKRLAIVVVDHIGLVKPSARALKSASREQQVAETSRGLRFLAGSLGAHVIGVAQIGRGAEARGESMPKMHHLRESGAIENDADNVILLHRERDVKTGMFVKDKPAALAVAKGRLDDTGIMLLRHEGEYARFSDWGDESSYGDHFGI